MTDTMVYVHHSINCAPRTFATVADDFGHLDWARWGGALFGVWRSQIGCPRDELNVITVWPSARDADLAEELLRGVAHVRQIRSRPMRATLRPEAPKPPLRQGNYAFRWFELPDEHWAEFLSLCAEAWPGFEAAYDSQVIGLWRCIDDPPGRASVLLMTRRPDLAMWERSKIPAGEAEREVRRQLSHRYDLCDATWVYTTTLLTAEDRVDSVRWT
ncbi:MAG: hypothetical protein Q8M53_16335 [Burkholderiales bacterium]|nr:hypothetical protein [Burkholderiales bacterium]